MKWRLREQLFDVARAQHATTVVVAVLVVGSYLVVSPQQPTVTIETVEKVIPTVQPVIAPHVQSKSVTVPVDCAKVACLALTFDDGPNAAITPQVLDILERHHIRATFFVIGVHIPGNEELLRRIHNAGHEIGNHSWSHRDLTKLSPQEIEQEVSQTQAAIVAVGAPLPRLFRAPYGAIDPMVRAHVPLTILSWNIDPEDWKAKKPGKIIDHVLAHAKPGAIVDLHDIYQPTADALDPILTSLEQTYRLVTVSELLNLAPGQPGLFYGR